MKSKRARFEDYVNFLGTRISGLKSIIKLTLNGIYDDVEMQHIEYLLLVIEREIKYIEKKYYILEKILQV